MLVLMILVMASLPSIGDLLVLTSSAQHYNYCKGNMSVLSWEWATWSVFF